jgi:hypothetical protein
VVAILAPVAGQSWLQCQPLTLRGAAQDAEGRLAQTVWFIDNTAVANVLSARVGPLSPGRHQIALLVTDEDGLANQDQVQVVVIADSDCDGMSDAYEEANGLDPGFIEDTLPDNDQDGLRNLEEALYRTNPNEPDTDRDGYTDGEEILFQSEPLNPESRPGPPPLGISCSGGVVTLWWLRPAPGFVVEEASHLATSVGWTVLPPPYSSNATHCFVTLPQPGGSRFYRLRRP